MSDEWNNTLGPDGDQDHIEAFLSDTIQGKFDAELRQELEIDLQHQYRLSKKNRSIGLNSRKRIYYLLGVAAGFALLVLALNLFNTSPGNARELASAFLAESEIYHSSALKGSENNDETRLLAIRAFNAKEYVQAGEYFSQIAEKTEEDIFYSAVASLFSQKYEEAVAGLESVAKTGSIFAVEARWYLAIANILLGNEPQAIQALTEIENAGWNQEKIKALLKAIRKD